MTTGFVCSADIDRRAACDFTCGDCNLLLPDRRRQGRSWLHRPLWERRTASNWIPSELRYRDVALSQEAGDSPAGFFIWTLVTLLIVFNTLDSILTARALSLGYAEGNPVMAGLFEISVPLGLAFKFSLVAAGAAALWKFRHIVLATRAMAILTGCYGAVVLYHLVFQLSL
jgi:hypothetical protein